MATKASNQTNQVNEMTIEEMDDEALLKKQQEFETQMAEIARVKKLRADSMKENAYTAINEVIQKYFDKVLTREEITQYLHDKEYIMPMVKESSAGKVGRVKIEDSDIIFLRKYKTEDGTRDMSLKFASFSKLPVPIGGAGKELKKLQELTFEQLKGNFKEQFWAFSKTADGKKWIQLFFPNLATDIEAYVASKETATA